MHPTLIQVGGVGLHSYGISIAVGFIVAILLGVRAARRQAIGVERILDLAFWILVSSILGSRLLFVITDAPAYLRICLGTGLAEPRGLGRVLVDCSRPLHLWEGGLVFYGGLLGALLTTIWFCRRRGLGFFRVADLVAPLLALGHFFGRLGCFAAGCCYGKPTASVLGVRFPAGSVALQEMVQGGLLERAARHTPAIHPTQLYESLAELSIFLLLTVVGQRKRYHGQVVLWYLVLYPLVRFLLEMVRADPDRRFVLALPTPELSRWLGLPTGSPLFLSTSQLISLGLLLAAGGLLLWRWRQARATRSGAGAGAA